MKVLAIGRPRAGVDAHTEIARHATQELRTLWEMYRGGTVREMYSPGGPGAVLVLEVGSVDEAAAALCELPLVSKQIIDFELVELRPFAAFQMLFSDAR